MILASETFFLRVKVEKVSLPKVYSGWLLIKLPALLHKSFSASHTIASLQIFSAPLPRAGVQVHITAKGGPDFSLRTFRFCLDRPLPYMLSGHEKVQVFKLNYPCYFYTSKWKPLCHWYAVSIFLLLRTFMFFLPKRKQILDLHAF